jgi:DNA-directed RNA polymerase specialized sigma24 family protein
MSTKTLLDTPTCFEKRTPARIQPSATIAKDGTDWREIAREALRRMTLADMLRLALDALTAKYREELFLQDVQNLNSAETAWVLDIPVVAVQSRLR